jgi:hypothetical protein
VDERNAPRRVKSHEHQPEMRSRRKFADIRKIEVLGDKGGGYFPAPLPHIQIRFSGQTFQPDTIHIVAEVCQFRISVSGKFSSNFSLKRQSE